MRYFNILLDFLVPFGIVLRLADFEPRYHRWRAVLLRFLPQSFFGYWLFFGNIPVVGGLIYMLVLVPLQIRRHPGRFRHVVALRYYVVILIGFGSVWSFVGHTLMAEYVAGKIGWSVSPFQTELAFYTLGTGVAAMLAVWIGGHLLTALVLSKAIFWYGAAGVHVYDFVIHENTNPLNIGAPLLGDIIYPTLLLWLLWKSWGDLEDRAA